MSDKRSRFEEKFDIVAEEMSPQQLIGFLEDGLGEVRDVDVVLSGDRKSSSIMKSFVKLYGQPSAGKMIRRAVFHYKGKFGNRQISINSFVSNMKWFTDQLYTEIQQEERKSSPTVRDRELRAKFMSLEDL